VGLFDAAAAGGALGNLSVERKLTAAALDIPGNLLTTVSYESTDVLYFRLGRADGMVYPATGTGLTLDASRK
jgi:hypothetical protein